MNTNLTYCLVLTLALLWTASTAASTVEVKGAGSTLVLNKISGFDGAVGVQRENAYKAAMAIWADILVSKVSIRIDASWEPLTCSASVTVLGSAGPYTTLVNASVYGLTANTRYPDALYNAAKGSDAFPTLPDITARFNSVYGTATCNGGAGGWYYGTDGNAPSGKKDFLTVALHEIGHGLGILDGLNSDGTFASTNPFVYDRFLYNAELKVSLVSQTAAARALSMKKDGKLVWSGAEVNSLADELTAGVNNSGVQLYAPSTYNSGSSVSHFDTDLTPNELMEPFAKNDVTYQHSAALLNDIGWSVRDAHLGATNSAPTVTGVPAAVAVVGRPYTFTPVVSDTDSSYSVEVEITPKPAWLSLIKGTGLHSWRLEGTPSTANVGTTNNIVLSVEDGELATNLPTFSLTVLSDTDGDGLPNICDARCIAAGFTEDADDDDDTVADDLDIAPLDNTVGKLPTASAANPGTVGNPYLISTLSHLKGLSTARGYWASGVHLTLTGNIDASATVSWNVGDHDNNPGTANEAMGFSPIGVFDTAFFEASFDGAGYEISNLYINRPASDDVGLFGATKGAVIANVGVTNVNITGKAYVGGLMGYARNSSITDSYATGAVEGKGSQIGGLVGRNDSDSNTTGSYAAGSVAGTGDDIGGLVGRNNKSSITASYATGAVEGTEDNVGGLLGYASSNSNITNSYATGAVEGAKDYVGGLVGYTRSNSNSNITNSYATGSVSGRYSVGGLLGYANNDSRIIDSYATGTVEGTKFVGGLLGYANNDSSITASYWNTETSEQSKGVGFNTGNGTPTGLNSAQMAQQASFAGFDFVGSPPGDPIGDTPWLMFEGATRPYLYWQDEDEDGIAAYLDGFPLISVDGRLDTDGDGRPNECNTTCQSTGMSADTDDDNDGVLDTNDAFPLISLGGRRDPDGDGRPNKCNTACLATGMTADTDDDNDGVLDTDDAFPLISLGGLTDTDGDGRPNECNTACQSTGMSADTDDDNDGVLDTNDAFPLISLGSLTDTDGDGRPNKCGAACQATGMSADDDDDGDGVADNLDIERLDNTVGKLPTTSAANPGTVGNPYLISTLSHLKGLSTATGYWASGVHLTLTGNIDASATFSWNVGDHDNNPGTANVAMGFSPIGVFDTAFFEASFDGAGWVISNLYINRPASADIGLFGATKGAVIANVGVTNVNVTGQSYVGGLIGFANDSSRITASYAKGVVEGTGGYVGGLIGASFGSSITASYATGAAEGTEENVGGLVGDASNTVIVASYATGAVTGNNRVGGLSGRAKNGSSITASYATGDVNSTENYVGGLVGQVTNNSSMTASYWNTETSGQSEGVGFNAGTGTPTGLNSAQMAQQASFAGFDFVGSPPADPIGDTPWLMFEGAIRPYLYWQDEDGDGIAAYLDGFPLISVDGRLDTDGDGRPNECNTTCQSTGMSADTDDDNDGVLDTNDAFPLISLGGRRDPDGDGRPNKCNTACLAAGMTADTDDDNDGVLDTDDAFPLISLGGLTDTDGDGRPDECNADCLAAGMTADTDDDNDSYSDSDEIDEGTDPKDASDYPLQSGLPIWLLYEASQSK